MSQLSYEASYHEALHCLQRRDLPNALARFERLSVAHPEKADLFAKIALIQKKQGKFAEAYWYMQEAVRKAPEDIGYRIGLGAILRDFGKPKEALRLFGDLLKQKPADALLLNHIGLTFEKLGELQKAIGAYKEALHIEPEFESVIQNLGALYYRIGRYDAALACFERIVSVNPKNYGIYTNIGSCLGKLKRYDEAIAAHRKTIEKLPDHAGAYTNLGNIYNNLYRYKEGMKQHQKAIALDPDGVYAYANLANSLKHLGRFKEAIENYQKAILLDPDFVNAHFDLATTYLAMGRFHEGFAEYAWRFRKKEMQAHIAKHRAIFTKQQLTPSTDAKGKRVLVHTEQGFGDSIQFVRFVGQLRERFGCEVILQCRDELKALFCANIKNVDHFYARESEPLPDFDYQIAMLSLPQLYEVRDYEDIPCCGEPYLHAQPKDGLQIEKEQGKIYIGINWSTSVTSESHQERKFDIHRFVPLMDHDRIVLYSLQVGPDVAEIAQNGYADKIMDLSARLHDFSDTAALIDQLDLIITSDTAVAHLAGAMGKEVWIPLPKAADWRWGIKGKDAYLYPHVRLFRQKQFGKWESVFQSIYDTLQSKYKIKLQGAQDACA